MRSIALVPVGAVEEVLLAAVESALREAFGARVEREEPMAIPPGTYDHARKQFGSEQLLRALRERARRVSDEGGEERRYLGIADVDLFIPMLSFVFGQAQLGGPAAVVSVTRLRQEFYALPSNGPLAAMRLAKEAVHETGHAFGLTHCTDNACAMSLSTTIGLLDRKGDRLCAHCTEALYHIV